MKKLQTRPMLAAFFSSLVLLSSSSALALSIQFTAGNSGLTLQYDIPGMGTDSLTLGPGDPEQEFSLKGIAGQLVRLRIRVDSVVADSPVPVVNTVIRAFVTAMPAYEFALPLPFGDYGIETGLFKRKTFQDRNAPIEISLLCAVLRTDYDITFNLGQLFSKTWQGSKTLNDNVIRETIELEGEGLPTQGSLDLTIIPVKTIPLTFFVFSADMYDQNGSLIQPLSGVIPFPNGSYHLWLKPGFDIANILSPQSQACCVPGMDMCQDVPAVLCETLGGTAQGAGTSCATVECSYEGGETQACCIPGEKICSDVPAALCGTIGGYAQGTGTTCESYDCGF